MRKHSAIYVLVGAAVLLAAAFFAGAQHKDATPQVVAQFTTDGKVLRPVEYRRWIYLSSGFGMSYDPNAGGNGAPAFTNVFVNPASYDYFQANGKWPDKTMFVL